MMQNFRKTTKAKDNGQEFLTTLKELGKEKGIDEEVLFEAIEAALISAYKRNFGSAQNVRVTLSRETGHYHVYAIKTVVEEAAQSYEHPEEVIKWYYESPERLEGPENLVLEDNVVEFVLSQAKVNEKAVSFDELMGNA